MAKKKVEVIIQMHVIFKRQQLKDRKYHTSNRAST